MYRCCHDHDIERIFVKHLQSYSAYHDSASFWMQESAAIWIGTFDNTTMEFGQGQVSASTPALYKVIFALPGV